MDSSQQTELYVLSFGVPILYMVLL